MYQPMSEIRQLFEVNLFGMIAVTKAFLPLLGARPAHPHPPGRIVNMGSINGGFTLPFISAYSCTKHAVEAFSQGLRRELLGHGIEVATIEPGLIRTNMVEAATHGSALQRYADVDIAPAWQQFCQQLGQAQKQAKSPDIVCKAVRHAIESPRPRTRYPLDPLWRLGRILPDRLFDKLIMKMFSYQVDKMLRK